MTDSQKPSGTAAQSKKAHKPKTAEPPQKFPPPDDTVNRQTGARPYERQGGNPGATPNRGPGKQAHRSRQGR